MHKSWKISLLILVLLAGACGIACAQTTDSSGGKIIKQARFERLMKNGNAVILDVRTTSEYQEGHVPGAVLLDVKQTDAFRAAAAKLDPAKTYLVYCKTGRRSHLATVILKELGFQKVYDLKGGFSNWTGPVEK